MKVLVTQLCLILLPPWTVALQAPLSMESSRHEYQSGLPFPSPGDLPDPGIEPGPPAFQEDALPSEPPGKILPPELCYFLPSNNIQFTTTTESFQSCPTLCNPIDGSPSGSPVPGILQARTLEWVAISFSSAWKWKVKSLSCVRLLATPWTAPYQASPSMGFSRQEYWSGVPLPSPVGCVICKYLLPCSRLLFCFDDSYPLLCFLVHCSPIYLKLDPQKITKINVSEVSTYVSSRSFMVLGLTLKSLIHFKCTVMLILFI